MVWPKIFFYREMWCSSQPGLVLKFNLKQGLYSGKGIGGMLLKKGPFRESNPGPVRPERTIIPLDQTDILAMNHV